MSITEPTKFAATKQSGTALRFIISVTDGTNTYLFGNFAGQFTDGFVYHLIDKFSLPHSSDFDEKTCARAIVRLSISNLPYDGEHRLSDVVGDIAGEAAKIYVTADPNETDLSNCLCIFDTGITRSVDGYNDTTINITLEDGAYVLDTVLLTKQIGDM